jgi:hypothetical protein
MLTLKLIVMVHALLFSLDGEHETIEIMGYKNLEDFYKDKTFYQVYKGGATHSLHKIECFLYNRLSRMDNSERLKEYHAINWQTYSRLN